MPDRREHRGPHPEDSRLFTADTEPVLRRATLDLSWLLSHGYAVNSALKLVGDRYALTTRQRIAVSRSACGDDDAAHRRKHMVRPDDLGGEEIGIDGFNVLTSVEAALAGGVILRGRDDCYRDMASMHGSYKKVEETVMAIKLVGECLASFHVSACRWLLDEPVSNSGRLKSMLRSIADQRSWDWEVELVPDPDPILKRTEQVVASADSHVLNHAKRWMNLARLTIDARVNDARILDLHG